jgi:hypothetical protein
MKLFIGATQFNVPDENVLFYNENGVVSSNLTMGRTFDRMIPDDPNNFKMVDVRGVKHWYNTKYLFNPDVGKKEEIKVDQSVVKIRVEDKWYEYPDDQIKSWDSEGNIEWSDKIHWKFLRGRPERGDEFITSDGNRFNSNHYTYKIPKIDGDSRIEFSNLSTNEGRGYCIFLSLTEDFMVGFRVFIRTFFRHNNWFDGDLVIMSMDLSENSIRYIKSLYRKVVFVKPNYDGYLNINKTNMKYDKFIYNYYKLDIY